MSDAPPAGVVAQPSSTSPYATPRTVSAALWMSPPRVPSTLASRGCAWPMPWSCPLTLLALPPSALAASAWKASPSAASAISNCGHCMPATPTVRAAGYDIAAATISGLMGCAGMSWWPPGLLRTLGPGPGDAGPLGDAPMVYEECMDVASGVSAGVAMMPPPSCRVGVGAELPVPTRASWAAASR
eukprot:352088-Chlamydomonas_euryale.AAC.21